MGYDYETIKASVYEKAFKSEFGNPSPYQDWGFNTTSYFMGLTSRSPLTRTSAEHVYKGEYIIDGVRADILYSAPTVQISDREHNEVWAWFKNHRVDWTTSPANFDEINRTSATKDGIAHCIDNSYPGYGSLNEGNYKILNSGVLGDYTLGPILFHNAWMQHVASDRNKYYDAAVTHTLQRSLTDGTEIYKYGGNQYVKKDGKIYRISNTGSIQEEATNIDARDLVLDQVDMSTYEKMNQLTFMAYKADGSGYETLSDLNEFNTGNGYGYQYSDQSQKAILLLDTDFNTFYYKNSSADCKTDKYICVYLQGEGYSGYYIGFDFESLKQNEINNTFKADGICDDWIIKLTDVGPAQTSKTRILCEDLGTNDFDFNDVVIDVDILETTGSGSGSKQKVKVTVQAVGGTIPVCLAYGEHDMTSSQIESKAFSKNGKHELHAIFGEKETTPINVNASNGVTKNTDVSWTLQFGKNDNNADYSFASSQLDLQKINIYVQHSDRAEWLLVRNYDLPGAVSAPQKICVPQDVDWPDENEPIREKYPRFKDWVENPMIKFWNYSTNGTSGSSDGGNTGGINLVASWPNLWQLPADLISALKNGKEIEILYNVPSGGAEIALQSSWYNKYQAHTISGRGSVRFTFPTEMNSGEEISFISCASGAFSIMSYNIVQ